MGIQKRRWLFPVFACLVGSLIFLAPGSKVGAETLTTAEYTAAPQPIGVSPTPAQSLQGDPGDGFKPSLFTGSLVTTIPIEVPPGTNGVGPAISMEYDSGSNENGWLGLGWKIRGLSYIARSSEDGVPRYDSSDKFVLVLGDDTYKLVYGSDGYYHTQVETNLRIKNYGSYWEVIDNTGTKHRFGYNIDSQIPAIGKSAARLWAIDQTLDLNGNSVEYTYVVDSTDGGYYPYSILYTRGNGLSAYRKVQFEWEPRSDAIYDYASGSVVKLRYRLHRIATYTGATAIRNYIFSYVQSPYSARGLLQTVTMYNADQTASLRLAAMGYQQGENAFGTSTVWTGMGAGNVGDPYYFADFNGDGRRDIASVLAGAYNCVRQSAKKDQGKLVLLRRPGIWLGR